MIGQGYSVCNGGGDRSFICWGEGIKLCMGIVEVSLYLKRRREGECGRLLIVAGKIKSLPLDNELRSLANMYSYFNFGKQIMYIRSS